MRIWSVIVAVIFIIIINIIYVPIWLIQKKKRINFIRRLTCLALFDSVLLIIFATTLFVPIVTTFTPFKFNLDSAVNLVPFYWISSPIKQITIETIPNILIFIPLGIFIPAVFKKTRVIYKTVLVIFLITFSIEFIQYFIGRSSDIDDIIMNLLGGIIGYVIFIIFSKKFKDKKWWKKLIGEE